MHMVWLGLEWFFGGELGRILGGSNIFFQGGFVFFAVQTDLSAKYKQSKLSEVQPTLLLTIYPSKKCSDYCEYHGTNEGKRSVMGVYG